MNGCRAPHINLGMPPCTYKAGISWLKSITPPVVEVRLSLGRMIRSLREGPGHPAEKETTAVPSNCKAKTSSQAGIERGTTHYWV